MDVIVESKLLFLSFLLFLLTVDSRSGEPATDPAIVPGTTPPPYR